MGIHHNVLAKAVRNGLEIVDLGTEFIVRKVGESDVIARDVNARDALAAAIVELNAKAPKGQEDDMAKTAKKASKKAAKKAAKTTAKTNGGKLAKTIVADAYRAGYNSDDNCGDAIAKAITAYVKDGKLLNIEKLEKLATDNDIDLKPYKDLNNGQKSMNIRNILRGRAKRGEKVKIAGRVWE